MGCIQSQPFINKKGKVYRHTRPSDLTDTNSPVLNNLKDSSIHINKSFHTKEDVSSILSITPSSHSKFCIHLPYQIGIYQRKNNKDTIDHKNNNKENNDNIKTTHHSNRNIGLPHTGGSLSGSLTESLRELRNSLRNNNKNIDKHRNLISIFGEDVLKIEPNSIVNEPAELSNKRRNSKINILAKLNSTIMNTTTNKNNNNKLITDNKIVNDSNNDDINHLSSLLMNEIKLTVNEKSKYLKICYGAYSSIGIRNKNEDKFITIIKNKSKNKSKNKNKNKNIKTNLLRKTSSKGLLVLKNNENKNDILLQDNDNDNSSKSSHNNNINNNNSKEIACFGVYDGHNGDHVSTYLSEKFHETVLQEYDTIYNKEELQNDTPNLNNESHSDKIIKCLKKSCTILDNNIYENSIYGGSTAIFMIMYNINEFALMSLGDSQAILSINGIAKNMCIRHKTNLKSEQERILKANGSIIQDRVYGVLSVTRSFGDNDFKTSKGEFKNKFDGDLISNEPDIVIHKLNFITDEFIVLASDGLFDVLTPQEVVNYIKLKLPINNGNIHITCEQLTSYAIHLGSQDNITIIIICFQQHTRYIK